MTPEGGIRMLLATGIALALAGMLAGVAMAWAADHQARLAVHERYEGAFAPQTGAGDAAGTRERRQAMSLRYQRAVGVHTHAINTGLLAVLAGLVAAIGGDAGRRGVASAVLAGAAVLYPVGLFVHLTVPGPIGQWLAAFGAVAVTAAFAVLVAGTLRSR